MMAPLTKLIDGLDFGEGPRWHDGALWYSDFYQGCVYRVGLDGSRETVVTLDDRPSGLGWLPNGDLLIVSMANRAVVRFDGTKLHRYADLSALTVAFCNDMVVDTRGNAYVGHFGFDAEAGDDFVPASLILVRPDGSTSVAAPDIAFPNGAVITNDGKTLIVAQSFAAGFVAFDIEMDGSLSNRRDWATVEGTAPDGCTQDAEGAIWFSDAIGSQVVRVREGGEVTHRIPTPQPTFACMLGGVTGSTLFVLTAVSATAAEAAGSRSGCNLDGRRRRTKNGVALGLALVCQKDYIGNFS